MPDIVGRDIGRYHIIEQLGKGGMANIYKAFDTRLEREVAIKIIRIGSFAPEVIESMLQRFEREGKSLARMMHPNIVPIHDYGEFKGSPYLVMAYIPGGTLKKLTGHPMDYRKAARLLAPVAHALAYAHSLNIIHRDIKPSNILITTAGEPMLSDFGVAKILEGEEGITITATGVGVGTPEYMAPELWENQATPQSDIYSLGVVFYELVTGRRPYTADTPAAVLRKQLMESLPAPRSFVPDLPGSVEQMLFKALAKNPANRYASMDELATVLEQFAATAKVPRQQTLIFSKRSTAVEKGGDRTSQVASQTSSSDQWIAGQQEVRSIPSHAGPLSSQEGKPANLRIPLWGYYILGGLLIISLLVGAWALRSIIGEKNPPPPAVVAQVTNIRTSTPTPVSPTLTPTFTPPPATSTSTAVPPTQTPTLGVGSIQLSNEDGMILLYVPASNFSMGSKDSDKDAESDEKPQHLVWLDAFWIDQTEVTNAMFSKFMAATGYKTETEKSNSAHVYNPATQKWAIIKGADWSHPQGPSSSISGFENHPAVQISWDDANAYCQWAGRRLPSEAEWEKAARGSDQRLYPWGNLLSNGNLANFADRNLNASWADKEIDDGYLYTAPVKSYPDGRSPYGAFDMSGNVWEWVADWYDGMYYGKSPYGNPHGPSSPTEHRSVRGGGWNSPGGRVRPAHRDEASPTWVYDYIGFRCAVTQP